MEHTQSLLFKTEADVRGLPEPRSAAHAQIAQCVTAS